MDDAAAAIQQQLPPALRQLQPTALQAIHHGARHPLDSQLHAELQGLDAAANGFRQLQAELGQSANGHHLQPSNAFNGNHRLHRIQPNTQPHTPPNRQQDRDGGQFGILTPGSQLASQPHVQHNALESIQQDQDLFQSPDGDGKTEGHFGPMKMVADPPNLKEWRQKLFNVNETIVLTEDQFRTYFPHVDNIYSHRSTQKYKRQPFISHYWDCRLKGRPPGTPKSEDPSKKKRKRTARQRDLCDVKIKITEHFATSSSPQNGFGDGVDHNSNNFLGSGRPGTSAHQQGQQYSLLSPDNSLPVNHPGATGEKYYTVMRVNGNNGNGKGDGVDGPHRHSLEESDRVKKNSVQRHLLKEEKVRKKTQKSYHKKATGTALTTVRKHSKEAELKLFGSCFCPFVQRVWIALEVKGIAYQYIEVDPYKKPESLLEVNPRGLVPALRHGNWCCYESTVLLEYLEDLGIGSPLLPPDNPQLRAHCRLWSDHINRNIIPGFYRVLQAQELDKQLEHREELKTEISKLVDACSPEGPFFLGQTISIVDVQFAPWMLRLTRVMKPYRAWPDPEAGSRWGLWLDAIEKHESVKATTSTDDLYLDSYERYAENRPDTSQVAQAINFGRGLP